MMAVVKLSCPVAAHLSSPKHVISAGNPMKTLVTYIPIHRHIRTRMSVSLFLSGFVLFVPLPTTLPLPTLPVLETIPMFLIDPGKRHLAVVLAEMLRNNRTLQAP